MNNLLADLQIAPNGGFTGLGTGQLTTGSPSNAALTFSTFISSTIGVMTIIAIIWFIFLFITGAIGYMTSGGDKAAIEGARKKIVNGVVGLVIVVIAIFIIRLIGYLLGIDILNFVNLLNFATTANK